MTNQQTREYFGEMEIIRSAILGQNLFIMENEEIAIHEQEGSEIKSVDLKGVFSAKWVSNPNIEVEGLSKTLGDPKDIDYVKLFDFEFKKGIPDDTILEYTHNYLVHYNVTMLKYSAKKMSDMLENIGKL